MNVEAPPDLLNACVVFALESVEDGAAMHA
jgi:hypothetical protein